MPPVGFKRSRALWDDARRPRPGRKNEEWMSLFRAILYELQPIRFSEYNVNPNALAAFFSTRVLPTIRDMGTLVTRVWLPTAWSIIRNLSARQWMVVGGIFVYFFVVRWIHELLDAGPLVLIMTALAIIFTVGLGEKVEGEMSAYSAFNRGFQKLMGSVDVEALVNQHVGGGMMMAAGGDANAMGDEGNDRNRRQPRRGNNNNLHNARRDEQHNEGLQENDDDDDDSNNNDEGEDGQQRQHARKSGKKNRRRNQEERQDQRRQREAARAMGLDGAGGQAEAMAMQQLIEEQVAAGNQNQE